MRKNTTHSHARSEVRAAKALGQHFLRDEGVIARMIGEIAPKTDDALFEIGPGLGALTLPVLAIAGQMTAVEFDPRVLDILARKAASVGTLHLMHGDVLDVDLASLAKTQKLRVIGNLPYNLSSPILFHCLAARASIYDMHFMLQKEVVDRITATPGSKAYGRLSVMVQQVCDTESLFDIAPDAFDPPPKVDSAVVRLVPLAQQRFLCDARCFDAVVRAAFAQRRKMLRKSLAHWFDAADFAALAIDAAARPETLDGSAFARLADRLHAKETQGNAHG